MPEASLLPLFPLGVVLFPHSPLPLHIFEDRYKEMIGTVIDSRAEFGVVLASEEGIAQIGCTAVVDQVLRQYPDGRMDIVTQGQRRFAIRSLNQEKSYLRGEVEFFDDTETIAPSDLRQRAVRSCQDLPGFDRGEIDSDEPQLSYRLCEAIEDTRFRQELLVSQSEPDRLRKLIEFIPRYSLRQAAADRARELAPKNGHAHPQGS